MVLFLIYEFFHTAGAVIGLLCCSYTLKIQKGYESPTMYPTGLDIITLLLLFYDT